MREIARAWSGTAAAERVESVSALMFGEIAIEESRRAPDPGAAAALLAEKAVEAGSRAVRRSAEELDAFLARVSFAAQHGSGAPLGDDAVEAALRSLATGLKSFAELEAAARRRRVAARAGAAVAGRRRAGCWTRSLPSASACPAAGRCAVHYEPDQPPWIASRLQDFFGMRETPAVARGAVPLVVRLLAPNQRPVQMTSDLAGFWQRLYPQVRNELSRRYPKHAWPEKPT